MIKAVQNTDAASAAIFLRSDIGDMWRDRDPFHAAQAQTGQIYRDKEGRRTLRFEHEGHGYFLKLHQGVGWKEIFKNLLQGRLPVLGAENEYRAIRALEKIGIDTLSIAAYGKRGRNPATQLSFLVTDELRHVESLEDICARWPQQPPAFALKRKLIERVAAIARKLHGSGINHRDFYLCHFLLERDHEPLTADNLDNRKLYLMDLHRAQIRERIPPRWQIKDIGGLYYSALDIGLSRRDILRFMRIYTGKPLRESLRADAQFWNAVRERARRIYVRDFHREPQSRAWFPAEISPRQSSIAASRSSLLDGFLQGERRLTAPTTLSLTIDGQTKPLHVEAILRLLPRKRLVVKARLDGKRVVAKLFARSASSARHVARERAGYECVVRAGVRGAELIDTFTTVCGRFEGVIYEFIDAPALSACWPRFDANEKQRWLQRVTQTMFALHQAGVYQSDIHADNFLLKDDSVYLLDLGSIVVSDAPLSRTQSIDNLGALVAQFTIRERKLFAPAIDDYRAHRQWNNDAALAADLSNAVDRHWRWRKRDYLDKALRECKLTSFEQTFRQLQALRRTWLGDDLSRLCADPDAFMAKGILLKAGNTATVVKTSINDQPVIIKRYNIKNWRHALSRGLRATRARHSWLYAHWLELAGIDSIQPIALIEQRFGFWRGKAYFVGTWIDAPDLLSLGKQRRLSDSELIRIEELLESMRIARLSHGDFKGNNLLIEAKGVALIDLDAMREHANEMTWRRAFQRDLARLLRNWPADSDIYRQLKHLTEKL